MIVTMAKAHLTTGELAQALLALPPNTLIRDLWWGGDAPLYRAAAGQMFRVLDDTFPVLYIDHGNASHPDLDDKLRPLITEADDG